MSSIPSIVIMSGNASDEDQELHDLSCKHIKTVIQETTLTLIDSFEQAKTFVDSGRTVNITEDDGVTVTPAHTLLLRNIFRGIEYLSRFLEISVNATSPKGNTLLLLVCSIGDTPLDIIRLLLEKGAHCNVKDVNGDSPLQCSIKNHGDPNVISLLMQHGAHIDDLNRDGQSALHLACCDGNAELVSALLYWGADPLVWDKGNQLPLDSAVQGYYFDIVDLLFPYYFDCYCTVKVDVTTVMDLLTQKSDTMRDVLGHGTLSVAYDKIGLEYLQSWLLELDPEWLQLGIGSLSEALSVLFQTYRRVLMKMLKYCEFSEDNPDRIVKNLSVLFSDPQLGPTVVSNTNHDRTMTAIQASFQTEVVPLPEVGEIIMCMLSYGIDLTGEDLVLIYEQYGYCDLFHDLLFMDIVDMDVPKYKEIDSLLPGIYFNFEHSVEYYMSNAQFMPPESWLGDVCDFPPLPVVECRARNVRELFSLFAHWRLSDFVLGNFEEEDLVRVAKERRVPSLLEISRNVAREHIVTVFKVNSSRQFCAVVETLPLAKVHKEILLLKKAIYVF